MNEQKWAPRPNGGGGGGVRGGRLELQVLQCLIKGSSGAGGEEGRGGGRGGGSGGFIHDKEELRTVLKTNCRQTPLSRDTVKANG